jgi:magnesium chelatase family protein
MLAKVNSCAVIGLDGEIVEVELDVSNFGLPKFDIVGLPDTAVQEARERVRCAIRSSGHSFPISRITSNLAPADLRKEGPAYDLPIAVGILIATGQVPEPYTNCVFLGELALDGRLRHTQGILPMVGLARERGFHTAFVPTPDAGEASLVDGIEVIAVDSLVQLVAHLRGIDPINPFANKHRFEPSTLPVPDGIDFRHVRGQEHVKRGLEVAAAGGHNVVRVGPERLLLHDP